MRQRLKKRGGGTKSKCLKKTVEKCGGGDLCRLFLVACKVNLCDVTLEGNSVGHWYTRVYVQYGYILLSGSIRAGMSPQV